jgi:hypothetical protein
LNDDDRCVPIGKCPDGYGRLDDDETGTCYPKKDIQKCPDGSIRHKFQTCQEVIIPICDENTPPGVTCRDEGDFTDCAPGFIDRGFGCEPEVCPEGQVGIPPNCQPISCDVEDPPPGCGDQPVICPDGSAVSPGNECPEPPENGGGQPEGGDGGDSQPPAGGDGNGGDGGDGGNGGDGSDGGNGGGGGTIDVPSLAD